MDAKLYCEPFLGGGAVFFAKEPHPVEVINDTNREIVNFYQVLQSKYDELFDMMNTTPHSRALHKDAKIIYENPHMFTDVQRAWAIWIQTSQGFASKICGGWAYARKSNSCEKKVMNAKMRFGQVYTDRLNLVQIECNNALNVIRSRDSVDSFFYCDPPYVNTNMGHYGGYTIDDYKGLLDLLSSIKGRFLLSSFPTDILDQFVKRCDWTQKSVRKPLSASKEKGRQKIEVLTTNFII